MPNQTETLHRNRERDRKAKANEKRAQRLARKKLGRSGGITDMILRDDANQRR